MHTKLRDRLLDGDGVFTTVDPAGLSRALEASARFRRDTRLGALLHHPKASFREVAARNSLHVIIDGNTVSSHVDRVSPLNCDRDRAAHYSATRVLAHNVVGISDEVVRRLRRRRPDPEKRPQPD